MTKIRLEIISPEKTLANLEVTMAVLPGEGGEFGVLFGHENYITTITPGVINVYQDEAITEKYIVSAGTVKVTSELCTVIIDEAVSADKINFEQFESRLAETIREMEKESSEIVKDELKDEIKYLEEALKFRV
ncbi:ATP synthase, F1 sector, epsilon subunit epsilon [endosymbiont of Acanthamoeba sp. UWC8]|uniref:ATP synthase F1 subunit epsilon n=1 Tax=endosymbiont of Acanthamoeba sp. UWC8 TaxID=86106 RepID=UPI0004D0BA89|nr:ATP synthase F1 subunit epsilon [endosymbiont of Acanthamoeba sp. UWC8]AIF81344.1 ATP synthase, F1 sector, epsilon subunit epsilon [endosymbiont of Acanthamoeba sp. UWC8]